jgi:hypothetical protein
MAGSSGGPIEAWLHAEQRAAALERSSTAAVGEEAEVADADQAFGQNMDEKAAQKLLGGFVLIRWLAGSSPVRSIHAITCPSYGDVRAIRSECQTLA